LNPVFTVGYQIAESLRQHSVLNDKEIKLKVIDLLHTMGIPMPEVRMNEFPHQFSGGMRQRVMIAIAMSCNPKVLIADEPTTALDVTTQAQIFTLMDKLKQEHKTAIMLITHDMGVVAELADNVAVMYMGNIVEAGTVEDVLRRPKHPYTRALLASIPILGRGRQQNIKAIRGSTPDSYDRPKGCSFAPRCDYATQACDEMPDEIHISATHRVRCSQLEAIS
jgi:peptide/nickel transport system ATP-binding protein